MKASKVFGEFSAVIRPVMQRLLSPLTVSTLFQSKIFPSSFITPPTLLSRDFLRLRLPAVLRKHFAYLSRKARILEAPKNKKSLSFMPRGHENFFGFFSSSFFFFTGRLRNFLPSEEKGFIHVPPCVCFCFMWSKNRAAGIRKAKEGGNDSPLLYEHHDKHIPPYKWVCKLEHEVKLCFSIDRVASVQTLDFCYIRTYTTCEAHSTSDSWKATLRRKGISSSLYSFHRAVFLYQWMSRRWITQECKRSRLFWL